MSRSAYPAVPPRPQAAEFILPDRAAFLQALDLGRPALAPVRDALARGELDSAERAFIAHFRARDFDSPLLVAPEDRPRERSLRPTIADDCLRGVIWDGYNVYQVPPSGIDWHKSPLFCLPRFPIFPALLDAWEESGDPRYLRFVVDHGQEYMAAFPLASFAGVHSNEGYVNHYLTGPATWWCLHPNRLDQWSMALPRIRRSPLVTDAELLAILTRMLQEIRWHLTQMPYWVGQAHNVACYSLLVYGRLIAVFDDFSESHEWRRRNAEWLVSYIEDAFYPDGLFKELTLAYGGSCVHHLARLAYAWRHEAATESARGALLAMNSSLVALAKPTGHLPSYGDIYAGNLDSYLDRGLADWLAAPWIGAMAESARTHQVPTHEPPYRHWPPPGQPAWGGYYTMRSDWSPQARYLAIDGGPWGSTHQHMDRLSLVLTAHGADFITDPACTLYANNEPGARLSTLHAGFMHNTICVDGVDEFVAQPPYWVATEPLRNRWETGRDYQLFEGEFDFAPLKPVRWRRRVLFVGDSYWLLQDLLTGELPEVMIEQNFQFEEAITLSLAPERVLAQAANGARLALLPLATPLAPVQHLAEEGAHTTYSTQYGVYRAPGKLDHGRGWISRFNKCILPAPAVTWTGRVTLPQVLTLALVPLAPGAPLAALPAIQAETRGEFTRWHLPHAGGTLCFEASLTQARILPRA